MYQHSEIFLRWKITPHRPLLVDNEHVVAWDASLDYQMRVASEPSGLRREKV